MLCNRSKNLLMQWLFEGPSFPSFFFFLLFYAIELWRQLYFTNLLPIIKYYLVIAVHIMFSAHLILLFNIPTQIQMVIIKFFKVTNCLVRYFEKFFSVNSFFLTFHIITNVISRMKKMVLGSNSLTCSSSFISHLQQINSLA